MKDLLRQRNREATMVRRVDSRPGPLWRVGDKINFRVWDAYKTSRFMTGKVTSRIPELKLLNVMDDCGHMWRVSYEGIA